MNLNPHSKAIAIFSIALPSIVILALFGAVMHGRGKLQQAYSEKEENFRTFQTAKTQVSELRAQLEKDNRRDKIIYWNSKLDRDFIQTLSATLNKILAKYDDSVLKQTEMSKATAAAAIGSRTDQPHYTIQLSFEGGFKPMQMLMAELESEMPNLVIERMNIKPLPAKRAGEVGMLQFDIVYMGWNKSEA